MEEMGVGSNRAKRYSSQRQRAVPEPTPPMHLGVMEGHFYEPSNFPANGETVTLCLSSRRTAPHPPGDHRAVKRFCVRFISLLTLLNTHEFSPFFISSSGV